MGSDATLFLRQLLSNPRQVSAISPSSPWLARAMTAGLHPGIGKVVEFGPGTGRLTEAILARGIAPHDLTLFEMNADFVRHLRARFPGVTVHHGPAQDAAETVSGGVAKVISGLPLLSMPAPLREAIVAAAFAVLTPDAAMVQFTYGPQPPLSGESLARLGLRFTAGPRIWRNLPPARVFRFYRADEGLSAA
jgi:phosphatidylethanolamine/phosphatidyl-N-methylethanolamine N-methyltransferase